MSGIRQRKQRKTQINGADAATPVVKPAGDRGLVDAVHDVDLQGVQVRQDLVALGAGVFRDVPLMLPVSTYKGQTPITRHSDLLMFWTRYTVQIKIYIYF